MPVPVSGVRNILSSHFQQENLNTHTLGYFHMRIFTGSGNTTRCVTVMKADEYI
jgi:hypothetical protein